MANTWHGEFPCCRRSGYRRTSPVRAFPANGYRLQGMIGNVWDCTTEWWSASDTTDAPKA
ncbi:MAG: SUMF1/EgtB/PvdO family nonheme iron enzyme [Rhodopila sp.]